MRNWKAFAFAAVASTLLAGSLQAQTGRGRIANTGLYQTRAGGYYTSPYQARFQLFDGSNTSLLRAPAFIGTVPSTTPATPSTLSNGFGPAVDVFCVDFGHHGQSYTANFSSLADGASISGFTRTGILAQYKMAAWLASQLDVARPLSNSTQNGLINAAIWQIMNGTTVPTLGYSQTDIDAYKDQTIGAINLAEWVVVTDTAVAGGNTGLRYANGQYTGQEFLVRVNAVPEPATLLLLGTGLLATLMAAGALRRSAV
jgi:hypothetical protein